MSLYHPTLSLSPVVAQAQTTHDKETQGDRLFQTGTEQFRQGQLQQALQTYQQALAIVREVDNRAGEGWALNNIGEAYLILGQYQTALAYYQQALAIREDVGDRAGKGVTLYNMGAALEAQRFPTPLNSLITPSTLKT